MPDARRPDSAINWRWIFVVTASVAAWALAIFNLLRPW